LLSSDARFRRRAQNAEASAGWIARPVGGQEHCRVRTRRASEVGSRSRWKGFPERLSRVLKNVLRAVAPAWSSAPRVAGRAAWSVHRVTETARRLCAASAGDRAQWCVRGAEAPAFREASRAPRAEGTESFFVPSAMETAGNDRSANPGF